VPVLLDDIIALLRTALRVRQDQGGGDIDDDAARRLRVEEEEEDLDAIEEEGW
jgi:hypothetical protein